MSGYTDEAVVEGHDLIDGAEHEAQADPKDFQKVHRVGESGGSILPEGKAGAATTSSATTGKQGSGEGVGEKVQSKVEGLKEKLTGNK